MIALNNTTGPEERPLLLRAIRDMGPAPSMTYLQLYCLEISVHELYSSVFVNFPRLNYLDLSDSNIHDGGEPPPRKRASTAIEILILSHIEGSSSSVFDYILGSCPKLQRLQCFSSEPSYDIIKHLCIYYPSLEGLGFGFVRQDRNRHSNTIMSDDNPLRLTTSLQSASFNRINDEALVDLIVYGSSRTLSALKLSTSAISDICFCRLAAASAWSSLRRLKLDMIIGLTELGLFRFLQTCTQLEELSLKRIADMVITDRVLDLFGQLDCLSNITYEQPDRVIPDTVRRLIVKKYTVLNSRGNISTHLRLAFNSHTRVNIRFPTKMSVDTLLHRG
ncbi:hypothetical protein BX666DRAFT_445733 [Dichotomocladium elegans]|nr:hypothetical protein BX666DRAFT_445733 [Dichotomocladium elegans]